MLNIDFPLHFDVRGRTATADGDAHVRSMIEQLLFTNPGERVNRPEFGCGLRQLLFAANSPELATALQFTIQAALQRWLGDLVEIQALDVASEDSTITVDLKYKVRQTGQSTTTRFSRTI